MLSTVKTPQSKLFSCCLVVMCSTVQKRGQGRRGDSGGTRRRKGRRSASKSGSRKGADELYTPTVPPSGESEMRTRIQWSVWERATVAELRRGPTRQGRRSTRCRLRRFLKLATRRALLLFHLLMSAYPWHRRRDSSNQSGLPMCSVHPDWGLLSTWTSVSITWRDILCWGPSDRIPVGRDVPSAIVGPEFGTPV